MCVCVCVCVCASTRSETHSRYTHDVLALTVVTNTYTAHVYTLYLADWAYINVPWNLDFPNLNHQLAERPYVCALGKAGSG